MSRSDRGISRGFPYFAMAPAMIAFLLLTLFPVAYTVYLSFTEWTVETGKATFIGLGNYLAIVADSKYVEGFGLSIAYTLVAVVAELMLGFVIALLLEENVRPVGLFRALLIIPMVITPVVVGLTWRIMYSPTFGLISFILGIIGIKSQAWLASPNTAFSAVLVVEIWQWTPFMVLVLSAGLASLPTETFDAADVDGASYLQKLRFLTIPLMRQVIGVAVLFRLIDAFLAFDVIWMLTKGGPGTSTQTLNIYAFYTGFNWFHLGYAATIATTMLVFIILLVVFLTWVTKISLLEVE